MFFQFISRSMLKDHKHIFTIPACIHAQRTMFLKRKTIVVTFCLFLACATRIGAYH